MMVEPPEQPKNNLLIWDSERRLLRKQRTVMLVDPISDDSAKDFIEDFELLTAENSEPVTVIIGSNGGSVSPMFGIIRAIQRAQKRGVNVIGEVHGHAMSAAFNILQCCDIRTMGRFCTIMAHGVTTFTVGDMKDVEAERKLLKYWQKELAKLFADRCTARGTKYATAKYWMEVLESNTPIFFSSEEALEAGLVDEVG